MSLHIRMDVATYRLSDALPELLRGNLPKIEELEATLAEVKVEFPDEQNDDDGPNPSR